MLPEEPTAGVRMTGRQYPPGLDVVHAQMGRGWVWGSGRGVVTVRFETAQTPQGPVRSYALDDPELAPWVPEPVDESPEGLDEPVTPVTPVDPVAPGA